MTIYSHLSAIQKVLKVPKNQKNKFGNYMYRSCEDIVDAVKKELPDGVLLLLSDEVIEMGGRVYIKATATLLSDDNSVSAIGFAREPESKKGMDESQITGSTSSYARKYALNGLFCIDDTKDADTQDNTSQGSAKKNSSAKGSAGGNSKAVKPVTQEEFTLMKGKINDALTTEELVSAWGDVTAAFKANRMDKKTYDGLAKLKDERKAAIQPPANQTQANGAVAQ